jgi:hypothetical protein
VADTDYYKSGSWNLQCSICGRKLKADESVRNWAGQWRHIRCNEPRQVQDFVRGVPDDQSVPFSQPLTTIFTTVNATFPAKINPNPVLLTSLALTVLDENSLNVLDENGQTINSEGGETGSAQVILPDWVNPTEFQWSWASGGVGITLLGSNESTVYLTAASGPVGGIIQCLITNNLNGTALVTAVVSS